MRMTTVKFNYIGEVGRITFRGAKRSNVGLLDITVICDSRVLVYNELVHSKKKKKTQDKYKEKKCKPHKDLLDSEALTSIPRSIICKMDHS